MPLALLVQSVEWRVENNRRCHYTVFHQDSYAWIVLQLMKKHKRRKGT